MFIWFISLVLVHLVIIRSTCVYVRVCMYHCLYVSPSKFCLSNDQPALPVSRTVSHSNYLIEFIDSVFQLNRAWLRANTTRIRRSLFFALVYTLTYTHMHIHKRTPVDTHEWETFELKQACSHVDRKREREREMEVMRVGKRCSTGAKRTSNLKQSQEERWFTDGD